MADENLTELGLSTAKAVEEVLRLHGVLPLITRDYDNLGSASITLNKKGRLAKVAITELDDAMNRTTRTFAATKKGFALVGESVSDATSRIRELRNAMASIREGVVGNRVTAANQEAAAQARQLLAGSFQGGKASLASAAEMRRFQTIVQSLVRDVERGKVSIADLDNVFRKVAAGGKNLTVAEQAIADKFQLMTEAANNFGTAASNASNRATRAAQAQLKAQQGVLAQLAQARNNAQAQAVQQGQRNQANLLAQQAVAGAFGGQVGAATPKQILTFNAAMQRAYGLLQANKVNLQQFINTLNNVKAGNIQALVGPANQLQAALVRANNAFNTTGGIAHAAGQRVLLTWRSVFRLFQTEVAFRAFTNLQRSLIESVQTAEEYSTKIALIRTISQDAGVSYNQWSEGIRKVSDELGSPVVDTAAAAYDLLSNQVTRGAETMTVLREALEFGRTTNASAEDSVNLLSSAVNSFHLGADGAGRAARTFFTTIDLGRVTASELANSFGRSGVLADTLGVKLEELQAGISSMTRQGIKGNEAYTLLNNVFLKLIKPTEALKGWLHSIGFETGQDAIQALGFTNVLKLLDKEFQGNTAKVAKYFDELRGARGALNLTGKGLQEFLKDLEAIQKSSDNYDVAKKIVAEAPGTRLKVEFNQFKNYLINDFGKTVVDAVLRFTDAIGGVKSGVRELVAGFKTLAVTVATTYAIAKSAAVAAALYQQRAALLASIQYWGQLKNAIFGAQLAFAAVGGWPAVIAAAAAALTGLYFGLRHYDEAVRRANQDTLEAWQEGAQRSVDAEKEAADRRHAALVAGLDKSKSAVLSYFADLRSQYDRAGEAIVERQKEIAQSIGNTFDTLKGILRQGITSLEGEARTASENVKKATESIDEAIGDAERSQFERSLNAAKQAKNYGREVELVNARIQQLQGDVADAFDAGNIGAANRAFSEMLRTLEQISAERRKTAEFGYRAAGTRKAVAPFDQRDAQGHPLKVREQAFRFGKVGEFSSPVVSSQGVDATANAIVRQQVELLKEYRDREREAAESAGRRVTAYKEQTAALEDAFKAYQKFSVLDKKNEVKEEYQGPEGRAKALADLAKLQQAVTDGLKKAGAGLPQQLSTYAAFFEQFAKLQREFGDQTLAVKQQTENLRVIESIAKAEAGVKLQYDEAARAAGRIKVEVEKASTASLRLREEVQALYTVLSRGVDNASLRGPRRVSFFSRQELDRLREDVAAAMRQGGEEGRAALNRALDALKTKLQTAGKPGTLDNVLAEKGPDGQALRLAGALERLRTKFNQLAQTDVKLEAAQRAYDTVGRQVDELNRKLSESPEKFKSVGDAGASAGQSVAEGLDAATEAANEFIGRTAEVIKNLQEIERLKANGAASGGGGGGKVEHRARGGMVGYFSDGGFLSDFLAGKFARGADRVPVMAQRGEYIVNSRQTRQFLPLLRAINGGRVTPGAAYAAPTTNVGDINVTVQGGSTADGTIRNIAAGLRRGLRAGTIRL